ncbi:MAG: hypothetical protein J6S75_08100 [Thermoguttaceae bacterium]|nr:hypothetical protein [Thermoguttaceae bacterium]
MITKKKKYAIMAAVVIVNLLVIFIVKGKIRIIAPYREPSKSEVTRWAAEIERHLNEGDIDFVINRHDGNAEGFFSMGVTNWVDEELEDRDRERMRSGLAGVKGCTLKECKTDLQPPSAKHSAPFPFPNHQIEYELVYEDGHKRRGIVELFKDKWGRLGVVNFLVSKPIAPPKEENDQSGN